jgi:hypothetical protein
MAYYIFLKSLRSPEEFRKNTHVKIPPKSPCGNFQSLGKFRNLIFNLEILFPCFRPGRPCGPLCLWPSRLPLASPLLQAEAHRPAQAAQPTRAVGVIAEVRFLLGFTYFALGAFSLPTADMGDPLVSSVFAIAPADPGRETSTPPLPVLPAPRLDDVKPLPPPHHFPPQSPSNRALTSLNGLNGYSPPPLLRPPPRRPPPAL